MLQEPLPRRLEYRPVPPALKWRVPGPLASNSNVPLPSAHVCCILIPIVPPTSFHVPDEQSGAAAVNVPSEAPRKPESTQVICPGTACADPARRVSGSASSTGSQIRRKSDVILELLGRF